MRSEQGIDRRTRQGVGRRLSLSLALLALALDLAGCLGSRCSPGQVLFEGMCRAPRPVDARADASDGASRRDAAPRQDGEAGAAPSISGLGDLCGSSRPCTGEANYCVLQLGATEGYCSLRDCQLAPDDCPAGYTCRDLTQFMPGFPLFCSRAR